MLGKMMCRSLALLLSSALGPPAFLISLFVNAAPYNFTQYNSTQYNSAPYDFKYSDHLTDQYTYTPAHGIALPAPRLDWRLNDSTGEFTFNTDQLDDEYSYGTFGASTYYVDNLEPREENLSEKYNQLDFAKPGAIYVPEPSAVLLTFIGLVALLFSRRFKSDK